MLEIYADKLLDSPSVEGALYFLKSGHYMLRWKDPTGIHSKNVITPDVAAAFTQSEVDSGWIAPGIIREGRNKYGDWFVYFRPQTIVNLTLKNKKMENHLVIPIPATILLGVGKLHYLFALDGNEFEPDGKAYYAPFPNVHPDGQICFGDNPEPEAHHMYAAKTWKLFFESPFNGDLIEGKSKSKKDDVRKILAAYDGTDQYPLSDMVQMSSSIWATIERKIDYAG